MAASKWILENWVSGQWLDESQTVFLGPLLAALKGAADERQAFFENSHSDGFNTDNEFPAYGLTVVGPVGARNIDKIIAAVKRIDFSDFDMVTLDTVSPAGLTATEATKMEYVNASELLLGELGYVSAELLMDIDTTVAGVSFKSSIWQMAWLKQMYEVMSYGKYYSIQPFEVNDFFSLVEEQQVSINLLFSYAPIFNTISRVNLNFISTTTPLTDVYDGNLTPLSTPQEVWDYVLSKWDELLPSQGWLPNGLLAGGPGEIRNSMLINRTAGDIRYSSTGISTSRLRFKLHDTKRATSPQTYIINILRSYFAFNSFENTAGYSFSDFGMGINERETLLDELVPDAEGYYYLSPRFTPDHTLFQVPAVPAVVGENRHHDLLTYISLAPNVNVSSPVNGALGSSDILAEVNNNDGSAFEYYTINGTFEQVIEEGTTDTGITAPRNTANPATFEVAAGADDGALFEVNAEGEVVFLVAPDFDAPGDIGADNVYEFSIEVTDTVTSETVTQTYTVEILSITPTFAGPFEQDVLDNTNTPLALSVSSYDTLALEGLDAALFLLSGESLQFIAAPAFDTPLDVGGDNIYDVAVRATRETKQTLQAYVFTVYILPSFTAPFSATVNENQTSAITVIASNFDTMVLEGPDAALFDLTAGVVTFLTAPDFENPEDVGADNVYNFDVRATKSLRDTVQSYAITVANIVEAVTFTGPFAFDVDENQTAAFTADVAGDVPITFALSGVDAALFTVDVAGVVTFLVAPDFGAPGDVGGDNIHNITVEATNVTGMTPQAYTVTVEEEGAILDEIGIEIAGDDHLVATWSWTDVAVTKDWFGVTWTNGESKIIHDLFYPYQSEHFDRYDLGDSIYWREFYFGDYAGLSGADGAYFEYATPVGDTALITWTTNTMTVVRTPSIT